MKKKAAKKVKPIRRSNISNSRFGIINHLGTIWTPETFCTAQLAQAYLDRQRATWPGGGDGLRRHKVVPVRVTVTPIKPRGDRK